MSPRFPIRPPLSAQSDSRLAELAAAGDERAFEMLARRHRRALARYCRRVGVPEEGIDDVLQQSLTKAWLSLRAGGEVRQPRAWLYRIVHNAAINSIRAARLHTHEPLEAVPAERTPRGANDPGLGLRARDALGHVAALPEMQRDAILLTAIEGRSHEEAAGVLGVTDGAVRGLLYRARTTLRSAAAAFGPQGLLGFLARSSGESSLGERSSELAAGGAAAGAVGVLGKGVLATAVAGLLAAGGTIVHLEGAHGVRHPPRSASRPAHAQAGAAPERPATGISSSPTAAQVTFSPNPDGHPGSSGRRPRHAGRSGRGDGRGEGGGSSRRSPTGVPGEDSRGGARNDGGPTAIEHGSGDRQGSRSGSLRGQDGGSSSAGGDREVAAPATLRADESAGGEGTATQTGTPGSVPAEAPSGSSGDGSAANAPSSGGAEPASSAGERSSPGRDG